jgi:hypothetical protein
MDLPIRPVELERAVQASAARRTRDEHRGEPFEIDPNARRRRDEHREPTDESARAPEEGDQRIAPRASDEVGSRLDLTA